MDSLSTGNTVLPRATQQPPSQEIPVIFKDNFAVQMDAAMGEQSQYFSITKCLFPLFSLSFFTKPLCSVQVLKMCIKIMLFTDAEICIG